MSDPIADINVSGYSNIGEELAVRIRQQIGRELLEHKSWVGAAGFCVEEGDIREVCKLVEEGL